MNSLTTLANVKQWLVLTNTTDDNLLTRLIAQASRAITSYLQRPSLFQHAVTDTINGVGGNRVVLREWPVLSITSLIVGPTTIPAAPMLPSIGSGYSLEAPDSYPPGRMQQLSLYGYCFPRGSNNILVNYLAGYVVQNEAATVPTTPYQVTAQQPYGNFAVDQGVTYTATGVALVPVASGPTVGQYSVSTVGVYTFAAADASKAMKISYSYIPSDIEQVCIELVGERYRYMQRIGNKSKSQSGQVTESYDNSGITNYQMLLLNPYKSFAITC